MRPILIVEDDAALREALTDTLTLAGHAVLDAPDAESALRELERRADIGLVVSDVQMPGMDGHALLDAIKRRRPELPVVLMTAYGEIERAVHAMRAGASDYLPKPFEPERLVAAAGRWLLDSAAGEGDGTGEIVARDTRTLEVFDLARRVATSEATVLIDGESGSGKEVLARLIHRASARAGKPFVALNCAAIPDNLIESTLFGHERGAFTGATAAHAGKFEQAQGGTLLLDEISELPLALQAKLLRVLQERELERVGGSRAIRLDVRVLATSNRDLEAEVAAGRFREDLYYRLNVFPLTMPPLRERPDDIPPLALRALARHGASGRTLTAAARAALLAHPWPGNARELDNVMQRALILAGGAAIDLHHLHLPRRVPAAPAPETDDVPKSDNVPKSDDMRAMQQAHVLKTLEQAGGSRRLAAEKLGISERTLRHKLQQYREKPEGKP
jgi:two-component system response regulator FlrC